MICVQYLQHIHFLFSYSVLSKPPACSTSPGASPQSDLPLQQHPAMDGRMRLTPANKARAPPPPQQPVHRMGASEAQSWSDRYWTWDDGGLGGPPQWLYASPHSTRPTLVVHPVRDADLRCMRGFIWLANLDAVCDREWLRLVEACAISFIHTCMPKYADLLHLSACLGLHIIYSYMHALKWVP